MRLYTGETVLYVAKKGVDARTLQRRPHDAGRARLWLVENLTNDQCVALRDLLGGEE